jgi:hypothetical protein
VETVLAATDTAVARMMQSDHPADSPPGRDARELRAAVGLEDREGS